MRSSSPVRRRSPQIKVAECGPFLGVRDSLDPSVSNDPRYARELVNVMPRELDKPTTFVGRPGFDKLLSSALGASTPGTGATTNIGQCVHHFIDTGALGEAILLVVGGKARLYFTASDSVLGAPVMTQGQDSERCFALTFGNSLIMSDGVSVPKRFYDVNSTAGTSSSGTLTDAPIFYGQPVVYYAKLFAIKNAERNVIVWSEENDPTIGYETTPYSNSWELGQTSQEPLYALAATNEALYYFRARSTGAIRGAVTPEFTTDGTHEGISQTQGTVSPDGVCTVGERVFFIDADAQPCVIDGGKVRVIEGFTETLRTLDKTKLSKAITRYNPTTGLVYFGVVEIGQEDCSAIMCVNPVLNTAVGVWRGFNFTALGIVKPGNINATGLGGAASANGTTCEVGVPALLHIHTDGYVYIHGTPNGNIWDDYLDSGTVAIAHAVESSHLATDTEVEKRFQRADLLMRVEDGTNDVGVRMITPYGSSTALEVDFASGGPNWDEFNWDEAAWGEDYAERHGAVGFNQVGRWARVRLEHQETGEKFGFTKLSVNHTPSGNAWQAA